MAETSAHGGSRNYYATQVEINAHEAGLASMKINNLEGNPPLIDNVTLMSSNPVLFYKPNQDVSNYRNKNEMAASDIGNVVLSETIKSGVSNIKLQDYYYGGCVPILTTEKITGKPAADFDTHVKLNTLSAHHDANYYTNNNIDIYDEYGVEK